MEDQLEVMNFEGDVRDTNDEVPEVNETVDEEVQVEEAVEERPKDKNIQALDSERARRKKAEAELKELKAMLEGNERTKANEEKVRTERESLRQKLLADELIDEEVADRLMETFGNKIASDTIAERERRDEENFSKQLSDLMKDETFYDADKYTSDIKNLMSKGLTMEQAYFASIGANRMQTLRKEAEVEAEQKFLNNDVRADAIDVGTAQSKGEVKRSHYTAQEQRIANESGLELKEVHKRMNMNTLDDFLNL